MKVSASVSKRYERCRIIRRKGIVRVICTNPQHNSGKGRLLRSGAMTIPPDCGTGDHRVIG